MARLASNGAKYSNPVSCPAAEAWRTKWVWLFPATYLVHIAEECFSSAGFPAWASERTGLHFTTGRFLVLNSVALALMLTLSGLASLRSSFRWLVATFGVIVSVNGVLHVAASWITGSYSPGTISGALLWIPLGALALHRARRWLSPAAFAAAVVVGLLSHGLVTAVAVSVSRQP